MESGLNIEFKADLAALSMELRRLQLSEEEREDGGLDIAQEQRSEAAPDAADALAGAREKLREAEEVGQARAPSSMPWSFLGL